METRKTIRANVFYSEIIEDAVSTFNADKLNLEVSFEDSKKFDSDISYSPYMNQKKVITVDGVNYLVSIGVTIEALK